MLLEEICDVGRRDLAQEMDTSSGDDGLLDLDPSERDSLSAVDRGLDSTREGSEFHWKKTRLLSMMEEVMNLFSEYLLLLFCFFVRIIFILFFHLL